MALNSASLETSELSSSSPNEDYDVTIQKTSGTGISQQQTESCLVQIYPADVVDGMLKLGTDKIVMGRDQSVSYVLKDNSVSRRHAEISKIDCDYQIRDLGSTNGTAVNGKPVTEALLNSGDTIQVGNFLFRFLTAGSVESKYHETVYSALTRDALTGTMNRRYMVESLKREVCRSKRSTETITVAMIDIDHFKSVNDTYGHLVGDEVLREFGKRIESVCREDDMLSRFGGEEFCLVLSATSAAEAESMLEQCRTVIADTQFNTTAGGVPITASFGFVCVDPGMSLSINEILEAADTMLYQAKETGRNRVCG